MGTSSSDMHLPTEDPPPYSLLDPFAGEAGQGEEPHHSSSMDLPPTATSSWFSCAPHYYSSISYPPTEEAPPYEAALLDSSRPLPLTPCELFKHQSEAREEAGGLAEAGLTR
uniref:Uncharacterized protein n=1 Tax=Knipowitschia caucasica TaxID=637954 RepID=A0AAV2JM45_KNICA